MSTINAEAYVINDDGTKTAIPVDFIDEGRTSTTSRNVASGCVESFKRGFARGNTGSARTNTGAASQAAQSYTRWYAKRAECGCAGAPAGTGTNAQGYAPQNPFTTVDASTAAPKRSLHLGRRIAGLGVAAIGVPLLILPGPGLALIGLGLLMVVMP
ncbi:MAG TPA: hypothetical protein K8U77_10675 [Slackia equolifaciens]|uniref:Uncharacterized protein n=1 Tax=Slackia equolifaciens TaxID=498718 RepID=A0A9D2UZ59_9ACTN|nr:hypothetical protein [Slackia equolifaciens]